MKLWRVFLLMWLVALGLSFVSQAYAKDDDDEDKIRIYVLAEKRGYDVVCSQYTSIVQVNERKVELERERVETNKANVALRKEVTDLKKKLPGLKALKGRKTTEAEKQEIQNQIDAIEAQIKDKEAQIKPAVEYVVKGPYSKPEDANAFIDAVEAEAQRAKMEAELKKK